MPSILSEFQLEQRTNRLFDERYAAECRHVSRFMGILMIAQWVVAVAFAAFWSPYTWIGEYYSIHTHLIAVILIGGIFSGVALYWLKRFPDAVFTRHLVAAIQLLWTCLLIHLSGGRIETHFHAFASLAILSLYRDWKILITAAIVTALDHFARGVWYPLSVFGIVTASPFRWIEHSAWVIFEISFLIPGCIRLKKEIRQLCRMQVETAHAKATVELTVDQRTAEIKSTLRTLEETKLQLSEAKEFADTIIDDVSGLFYVLDANGNYVRWNRSMQQLFGVSNEEMLAVPALERIDPDDREWVATKIQEVFENGQAECEARIITAQGIRHVVLNGRRMDVDGEVYLVGSGQDITERKLVEQSLAQFKHVLDRIQDCVFICRTCDLQFVYVNQGAIQQVGYNAEELSGMTPLDINPEFNGESIREMFQPLLDGRQSRLLIETIHRHKNGTDIPVEVSLQLLTNNAGETLFVAIVRDITDRKKEEQRRNDLEESLRQQNSSLAIALVDLKNHKRALDEHAIVEVTDSTGTILYVNDRSEAITGYTADELIGNNHRIFKSGIHPDSTWNDLRKTVYSGNAWHGEICNKRKDGTLYWVDTTVMPFNNPDGDLSELVVIRTDITERKTADAEKEKLQKQLIDASRQSGMAEVATGVLHNVGNILNSFNISTSQIQKQLDASAISSLDRLSNLVSEHENQLARFVTEDQRGRQIPEFLRKLAKTLQDERHHIRCEFSDILKNVEHIKNIVNVQQSMAKASGLLTEIDPQELISCTLSAVRNSMINHKIHVETEIQEGVPTFVSDKNRILQVLINLVTNAKDALVEHAIRKPQITISVSESEGMISLIVSDNGSGIDPQKLEQIFHFGYSSKASGRGFGLHHSATTAAELGGSLKAMSDGIGKGATFQLLIPRKSRDSKSLNQDIKRSLVTLTTEDSNGTNHEFESSR